MYKYDDYDKTIAYERVAQFRDQTRRFLAGELSEDEYRPLRLMNGLYLQRYAPMLRVAIPYGLLSSEQLRMQAHIARTYDKDYGHFSTRQNIQYNWPKLEDVPDILENLASVEMHANQTSGNCIRNVTSDHFAGIAKDEIEDPRPYCEIIRQWSTFHPEFSYLPRKFKIAVSGAENDRAAVMVHDIGIDVVRNDKGETGFKIIVGGGLGRLPHIGAVIRPFIEKRHLLSYLESILRVYNLFGRRDNMHKARIKILVKAIGAEKFAEMVEDEWNQIKDSVLQIDEREIERVKQFFLQPDYDKEAAGDTSLDDKLKNDVSFANWHRRNVKEHKIDGYRAVFISLKAPGLPPGDATSEQMDFIADMADRYSFSEIRVTHDQNLVLAHVKQGDLYELWFGLKAQGLATPNIGLMTDMICCPGLDFCALANAGSISISNAINKKFDDIDYLHDIGDLQIKMSGCMNACGHHHVGHIGILGVDKKGKEYYQLTIGGSAAADAALGIRLGASIPKQDVPDTIAKLLQVYVENREKAERFLDTYRRIGIEPFRISVYGSDDDRKDIGERAVASH
jgi:sulfite reductase (NADPH) hemoprotein beta-component